MAPTDDTKVRPRLDQLRADVRAIEAMVGGPQDGLGRRLYVIQAFVFMEAAAHVLKRAVLFDYEKTDYEGVLDTEEWMTAVGENYRIGDDGNPQYEPNRYRTVPHLLFCIKLCAKYNGKPFDPKQVANWSAVGQTRVVRDRLTHPTKMPDLTVTDEELRRARAAVAWFEDCITRAT